MSPRHVRKALVALATLIALAIQQAVLPDSWTPYAVIVLGVLNAVGVYAVPNEPVKRPAP